MTSRRPVYPDPSESQDQVAFVSWFRLQFPKVRILSIPNGAHLAGGERQRGIQMARLKREGLDPGAPDLLIPAWRVWVEMKRAAGGRLSIEQQDWRDYLTGIGDTVIVAEGFDEARVSIMRLGR